MLGRGWIAQALDNRRCGRHLSRHPDDARAGGAPTCAANEIDVAILHVPTIKPFDGKPLCARAQRRRAWLPSQNISRSSTRRLQRRCCAHERTRPCCQIALPDALLDAGAVPTLHDRSEISTDPICKTPKRALR
jgi:transketolase